MSRRPKIGLIRPKIGLIGDYNPSVRAHVAIPKALALAAESLACEVEPVWLPTPSLQPPVPPQLTRFDALWCVPASPYTNMDGALAAIRFAREKGIPFLGTCGGFQHALIEYARNQLGLSEADHAESNPTTALPLIAPLSCSLVGVNGRIKFQPGSQAAAIYGAQEATEEYHCNYGLNPAFQAQCHSGHLKITGFDDQGDARIIELAAHPFYLATLFQPELSALKNEKAAHPLITAFVWSAAASER